MAETTITCPKCGNLIEMTAAMTASIETTLRAKYEAQAAREREAVEARERTLKAERMAFEKAKTDLDALVAERVAAEKMALVTQAKAVAKQESTAEIKLLQDQVADQTRRLSASAEREVAVAKKEREVEESKRNIDAEIRRGLEAQLAEATAKAKSEAAAAGETSRKALEAELSAATNALRTAQDNELALRKDRAKLEEEKQALKLEVQRQIDTEREKIRTDALKQADEEHRHKLAESEKKLADVSKQLEEARRKADQGSQQTQGEVLELELESVLKAAFPGDLIEPIAKGVRGADVIQRVRNDRGQPCGIILWESKRHKAWQDGWLSKLRDDGLEAKADICGLLTAILPKDCANFGNVGGVWVTNRECVVGLAASLRAGLIQIAEAKRAVEGQAGKQAEVYRYLTSPQFRLRIEAVAESLTTMHSELIAEKRTIGKLWDKREAQIERAATNALGMHSDLAGIIGNSLPEIEGLSLDALEAKASG